jgi:hypothetical protein
MRRSHAAARAPVKTTTSIEPPTVGISDIDAVREVHGLHPRRDRTET